MEAKKEDIEDNTNSISSASEEILASIKRATLEYGVLI